MKTSIESKLKQLSAEKELSEQYNEDVESVDFADMDEKITYYDGALCVSFPSRTYKLKSGKIEIEDSVKYYYFEIGHVTPKGYRSKKSIDVCVSDEDNVTLEEAEQLMAFHQNFRVNNFDPFWHENESKRRNASAWNYIATNYITDPYCTK